MAKTNGNLPTQGFEALKAAFDDAFSQMRKTAKTAQAALRVYLQSVQVDFESAIATAIAHGGAQTDVNTAREFLNAAATRIAREMAAVGDELRRQVVLITLAVFRAVISIV